MAFITADRVKDTSTTTGTGNITVSGGAPFGYRTFSTVLSVGDTFYYCVNGQGSSEWEVGLGTYLSVNTFARTTVLASSASGSAVSFSSGTKNVFITLPANKTLQLDAAASPTAGAILYGTGSMLAYTAVGTSGQFLQSTGSGAPTWAPIGSVGTSISNGTSSVAIASSNGSIIAATNGTTAFTVDTSQNTTFAATVAMASSFKRNRIINGNMVVDQRNAGASVTPADDTYTLDRWKVRQTTASKFSVQQNAGSVTPPAGFANYLGVTSLSAYSVSSTDVFTVMQLIEGFNTADFAWGTASAQTVTLSFWVRSSLTGTFGGSLRNNSGNRQYPFSYTISAASTWEFKTISIAGDTTGTWDTGNTTGVRVSWGLGVGSSYVSTAGSWGNTGAWSVTGAVSVVGTNGATFYVTGVQLEVGTKATPYEMQIYSDQLAQCQRYYEASTLLTYASMSNASSTYRNLSQLFVVTKRTAPTVTLSGGSSTLAVGSTTINGYYSNVNAGNTTTDAYVGSYTASAEF